MIHPLTLSLVNLVNEVKGVGVRNADPEADMDLGAPRGRKRGCMSKPYWAQGCRISRL
jgi:hypothetical protein